jgi:hypothetical protein
MSKTSFSKRHAVPPTIDSTRLFAGNTRAALDALWASA